MQDKIENLLSATVVKKINFNVNGDLERWENRKKQFPNFTGLKRLPLIFNSLDYYIDKNKVDIICLQEASKPMVPKLKAHLERKGLTVFDHAYNSSPGSFHFIFAYMPSVYRVREEEIYQIYLTRSEKPTLHSESLSKEEKLEQHFGVEFERASVIVILENIKTEKRFAVVNNHFGLPNEHRLLIARELLRRLSKMQELQEIALILAGDFNQFIWSGDPKGELYMDQINILLQNGYEWVSQSLNLTEPKTTFTGFPYDYGRYHKPRDFNKYFKEKYLTSEELEKVNQIPQLEKQEKHGDVRDIHTNLLIQHNFDVCGGCLDGVYVKGGATNNMNHSRSKVAFFSNGQRIKPISSEEIQEMAIKAYKERDENGEVRCPYPSDHLLVHSKIYL